MARTLPTDGSDRSARADLMGRMRAAARSDLVDDRTDTARASCLDRTELAARGF